MFYGGKPVAYHQFPSRQIAFSMVEEESGINCGVLQDIFLKVNIYKSFRSHIIEEAVRYWILEFLLGFIDFFSYCDIEVFPVVLIIPLLSPFLHF